MVAVLIRRDAAMQSLSVLGSKGSKGWQLGLFWVMTSETGLMNSESVGSNWTI